MSNFTTRSIREESRFDQFLSKKWSILVGIISTLMPVAIILWNINVTLINIQNDIQSHNEAQQVRAELNDNRFTETFTRLNTLEK